MPPRRHGDAARFCSSEVVGLAGIATAAILAMALLAAL